jgi:hypothetical protein
VLLWNCSGSRVCSCYSSVKKRAAFARVLNPPPPKKEGRSLPFRRLPWGVLERNGVRRAAHAATANTPLFRFLALCENPHRRRPDPLEFWCALWVYSRTTSSRSRGHAPTCYLCYFEAKKVRSASFFSLLSPPPRRRLCALVSALSLSLSLLSLARFASSHFTSSSWRKASAARPGSRPPPRPPPWRPRTLPCPLSSS